MTTFRAISLALCSLHFVTLLSHGAGAAQCAGDCDADQQVQVDELVTLIGIALGEAPLSRCAAADSDTNGVVTVDEALTAVDHALRGCSERHSGIHLRSDEGDIVGQGRTEIFTSDTGTLRAVAIVGGVSVVFEAGEQRSLFRFAAPRGATLSRASYNAARRYPFNESGEPGLDVQVRNRGCAELSGSFEVLEVEVSDKAQVLSFAADFEQRCGSSTAVLRGEVRFNSTIGFSPPPAPRDIAVPRDAITIAAAVSTASNGDRILVEPGRYDESINFSGKEIEIVATGGPEQTELHGVDGDAVVRFARGEGRAARLRGFTLRGGRYGVLVSDGAGPTLENLVITQNQVGLRVANGFAALSSSAITANASHGIELVGSGAPEVRGNRIEANGGRGIRVFDATDVALANNVIRSNRGGIEMVGASGGLIEQNLIYDNEAFEGAGISWFLETGTGAVVVSSNTIADNVSDKGAALFIDGTGGEIDLHNNILVAAQPAAVDCGSTQVTPAFQANLIYSSQGSAVGTQCEDPLARDGNISGDPMFQAPALEDYHLSAASPAIDAGLPFGPAFDLDGDRRPLDGNNDGTARNDLGVDEANWNP